MLPALGFLSPPLSTDSTSFPVFPLCSDLFVLFVFCFVCFLSSNIYLTVLGLQHTGSLIFTVGSLIVACKLLVAAYGIYFPDQRLEPRLPALGAQNLSHRITKEILKGHNFCISWFVGKWEIIFYLLCRKRKEAKRNIYLSWRKSVGPNFRICQVTKNIYSFIYFEFI